MRPKMFALVGGLLMLAIGVLAFVPALNVAPTPGMPGLINDTSYTLFLGYFGMNVANKVALIALGLVGVVAAMMPATSLPSSILWSRTIFVISGVFAILGLFPQTNTLFGYMPLYGWNVAASAIFAILGAYFGFALTARVPEQKMAPTHAHVAGVR